MMLQNEISNIMLNVKQKLCNIKLFCKIFLFIPKFMLSS
jgi:hypothetical protein